MTRSDDLATDLVTPSTLAPAPGQRRVVFFWEGGSLSADLAPRGTVTIGRAASCAIPIDHRSVSRVHAALHVDSAIVLEDMGSANGTWVEGRRLSPSERAPLSVGAVAKIGLVSFVVVDDRARAEVPSEG